MMSVSSSFGLGKAVHVGGFSSMRGIEHVILKERSGGEPSETSKKSVKKNASSHGTQNGPTFGDKLSETTLMLALLHSRMSRRFACMLEAAILAIAPPLRKVVAQTLG
eukprot:380588-Amphidinium_carterae.1